MRWLARLLGRDQDGPYRVRAIDGIREGDTRVELEGEVEAIELLHDPIEGRPAVVLNYRASRPGTAQRYFGIQESVGQIEGYQATNFLLRDRGGAALIEVVPGAEVGELHARLREKFGVDLQVSIEHVGPGDRVRVRGRVRSVSDSSPHRREPWVVVVALDDIESLAELT